MSGPISEETIFAAVIALPSEQRTAYLQQACGGDVAMQDRISTLMQAYEQVGRFMDEPAAGAPQQTIALELPVSEKPGDTIGRYKLLEQIGEGGCGVVYVAEQEQPVRRRVALKVIKLGMDTKQVIARFEAERQALAMMDHPNIARVLDGGATDTGRPYFVMELVRGIKINDYCDQNKLSMRERLELFIQVCHAIQHAHQKGVIHRDIKPSNILVTINDGVAVPKVIDFGIAKATQGRLTDQTVYTAFEQFLGTPAYMSPEQAVMTSLDVDTRTDIYSLGVLLYELLTGKTPFETSELLSAGLDALRQSIQEKEPPRPSTRLATMMADDLTTVAQKRHADPPKLIHLVRGDLDWIVMKALDKDRTRRYETANGLAADVQRHLDDEPILARPPSNLYRLRRLARRHRLAFVAATGIAMALLLGAVASLWQAGRARQERDAATRVRWQVEKLNHFLTEDLLFQATPDENAREKKVTMEEVLARAAKRLDTDIEFTREPELEATLRLAIGTTYARLGVIEAERHLRRAEALRRDALGPAARETLDAQQELATFLRAVRKYAEADSFSRAAWEGRRKLLGPEHRDTLQALSVYMSVLGEQGKFSEAEPHAREVLRLREKLFGPDEFDTIDAYGDLAILLFRGGHLAEAGKYAEEELRRFRRSGREDTRNAILSANNVAFYRMLLGKPQEAESILVEARERANRQFGVHPVTFQIQHLLARVLAEQGRLDEAAALAQETVTQRREFEPGQEGLGRTLLLLGGILVKKGDVANAEPLLKEALALFREKCSAKPELAAHASNWLGAVELKAGAYAEAERLLLSNPDSLLSPIAGLSAREQRQAIGHIVELYKASNRAQAAAGWEQKLAAIQ